ncbi:Uncharacterised protein [Escherichia coli]|nr:Uncharacterised protein [Escherichia coli]
MSLPCQRCCITELWYRSVSKYNWYNHYLLLDRVLLRILLALVLDEEVPSLFSCSINNLG